MYPYNTTLIGVLKGVANYFDYDIGCKGLIRDTTLNTKRARMLPASIGRIIVEATVPGYLFVQER